MKKKLLGLKANINYKLFGHPDYKKILSALNELISEGTEFVIADDHKTFQRKPNSLFDVMDEPGYTTVERKLDWGKIAVDLYYKGKWIATR